MGAIAIITVSRDNSAAVKGIDQSSLPVYQQNWWVEIARGSARFFEAKVFDDNVVVGSLPYVVRRRTRLDIPWGISPYWSSFGGPVVSQALNDKEKATVLHRLIAQLPRKIPLHFICAPKAHDAGLIRQAFVNAGFAHSRRITYSQPPEDADAVGRLNAKHRSHIRSADRILEVLEIGAGEFTAFYGENLKAAGLSSWSPLEVAQKLIAKGQEGDAPQLRVVAARKRKAGSPYEAAIACAWDKERYYLWMTTRRRPVGGASDDKPHPDAIKLLIVKAMQHAGSLGLIFDIDGFTQGSENLYTQILKIPNTEFRDVFERTTGLTRWLDVCRPKIKRAAAFLGLLGR